MRLKYVIAILTMIFIISSCAGSTNTPAATQKEASDLDTGEVDTVADSGSSDLANLIKEIKDSMTPSDDVQYVAKYKIDYGEYVTMMTMYFKGDASLEGSYNQRQDLDGTDFTSRFYSDETSSTMCSIINGDWNCMKAIDGGDSNPLEGTEFEIEENYEELGNHYKLYKDGSFTVSGITVPCYTSELEGEKTKSCISKEGVMLYYEDDNNENVFEALEYSNSVSDSDFELPATPEILDIDAELAAIQEEYGDPSDFQEEIRLGCREDCETFAPDELEACRANCDEIYG